MVTVTGIAILASLSAVLFMVNGQTTGYPMWTTGYATRTMGTGMWSTRSPMYTTMGYRTTSREPSSNMSREQVAKFCKDNANRKFASDPTKLSKKLRKCDKIANMSDEQFAQKLAAMATRRN